MKFIFFGSPIFARIVLEQLETANLLPEVVVCNPDRPAGRHKVITPPEIKRYILEKNLPIKILQPEAVTSSLFPELVEGTPKFDFFLVAAYSKILKSDILKIPRLGTIGIHSSLLPKYRGTSPIQTAIMADEKETGVTIYLMDDKMDHGPILTQAKVPITDEDTHETLFPKIWAAGGQALVRILSDFLAGKLQPAAQDESNATYTRFFTSHTGYVDPGDLEVALRGRNPGAARMIFNKIRAYGVEPGVWSTVSSWLSLCHSRVGLDSDSRSGNPDLPLEKLARDKRVKLLEAKLEDGKLVLKKIQIEGEKPRAI